MTRENIIRMAREAGISESHAQGMQGFLERFAALVAAAEREACAMVCEQIANELGAWPTSYEGVNSETKFVRRLGEVISQPFTEAIRARGQA